jgi:hypothetical protein
MSLAVLTKEACRAFWGAQYPFRLEELIVDKLQPGYSFNSLMSVRRLYTCLPTSKADIPLFADFHTLEVLDLYHPYSFDTPGIKLIRYRLAKGWMPSVKHVIVRSVRPLVGEGPGGRLLSKLLDKRLVFVPRMEEPKVIRDAEKLVFHYDGWFERSRQFL